ncbi:hypothetical protein EW145_g3459 [Phellinidium pouzarii]|uniref:Protein kinase domain-containing protein n=1 Tax=Phellinidium pouzarii TaxID=167371 RepID=A0A4S4L8Y2_9AGAM|nr:hypothetical protein EW145_g3459 [Phellinidium pouzarii]
MQTVKLEQSDIRRRSGKNAEFDVLDMTTKEAFRDIKHGISLTVSDLFFGPISGLWRLLNVWSFEALLKTSTSLGSVITFGQMLFITCQALPQFLVWDKNIAPLIFLPRLSPRQVPLREWFLQVLTLTTGALLNNRAFAYNVPLTLQIVFRSSGLPVSMLLGSIFLKKRYSITQIVSVLLVTTGVILATLSKPSSSASVGLDDYQKYMIGIFMLTISILLTGVLGVLQERTYMKYGPCWKEGIFYTHLLSLPIFLFMIGDIYDGLRVVKESSEVTRGVPKTYLVFAVNLITQLLCVSGVNQLASQVDFEGDVTLFHFLLLKSVGKGAFGKVRVVQHKQTRDLYALKYINKSKCLKMKAIANIIQERRLLEEVDHPFIVNLRYAFQDDENCFFVLDLMLGGDLRFHLERLGSLSEDAVRVYVAELGSALAFLHEKKIIHRDLKPDNILLDERGHAHITDFNIAVHYSERRLLTGVAGSLAYMGEASSPEVLAKKGYSYMIDWWSLGVCAYELVFGRRPFRGKTNPDLTHAISRDPLRFPEDSDSKCSKEGKMALKDSNKANFDSTHELEELLLEDNPLKARKRKANQDINNLSIELRQLEEQFTTYDYKKMHRRSYYPHNQQIVSQMTATSSTGFVSSRPETPNPTDAELGNHQVNIRGMSLDSHDPLEMRAGVRRLTDEYVGGYSTDAVPMNSTVNEKEHLFPVA